MDGLVGIGMEDRLGGTQVCDVLTLRCVGGWLV